MSWGLVNLQIPPLAKYALAAGAALALYLLGRIDGERAAGQEHIAYVEAQAASSMLIAKAQAKVLIQTEIKYQGRIKTVYLKGEEIEKLVPVYVTRADDERFGVNAGFVRSYNAAWSGEPAGPAAESDADAAGVPVSEIAAADAHNATACRAWRELALGLREHYESLKAATNHSD